MSGRETRRSLMHRKALHSAKFFRFPTRGITTRRVERERVTPTNPDPQAEAWRKLIEEAPDDFHPKRREAPKITLPRLKFMEKPDEGA